MYVCMFVSVCICVPVCLYVYMGAWAPGCVHGCVGAWVHGCRMHGLQNAALVRKSAPWPPNIFDKDVFSPAPATCNASLPLLFKGPTPAIPFECFTHCGLEMRQQHAYFPHLDSQKCSEPEAFLTVWLRTVLRTTAMCDFWPAICQMAQHPPLYRAYFSSFQEPRNIGKLLCFATFYFFARLDLVSSVFFSSLICMFPLFSLTLPTSVFPSVHIVGSLTSKCPSIKKMLTLKNRSVFDSFSAQLPQEYTW